ncbi:GFA family protein [Bordetella sp. 2513F-2]
MKYRGSCHCQAVQFEVEGTVDGALSCNCSICRRKGALLWFVPRTALSVQAADDALATYTFNRHVIQHRFCRTCGIHPFGEGQAPDGTAMAAINLRCLEDVDLASVPVREFDGRSA